MKKTWMVSEWGTKDSTKFFSVDYRPVDKDDTFQNLKPLIQIPVTDRYTIEEYREISQLIADRMNAWEVEQKLVE